MRREVLHRLRSSAGLLVLLVAVVALFRSHPFLVVPAGHRAVAFNVFSGVEAGVRGEGFHFFLPLVQYPTLFDVRTTAYTMASSADTAGQMAASGRSETTRQQGVESNPLVSLTADGQPVTVDLTVLYHPDPAKLPLLFRDIGTQADAQEKIVRPKLRTIIREAVAQFPVTKLYSEARESLEADIAQRAKASFATCYLVLEDVKLRNIAFSQAFQDAIEKKQVAQQQVQRMVYMLQQSHAERDKAVAEAQGEADAMRMVAESLARNPRLIDYEYVEKLNPQAKSVVVGTKTIVSLGNILGGE